MSRGQNPLPAETREQILQAYPARTDVPWDVLEDAVVLAIAKRFTRLDRLLQRVLPGPTHTFVTLDAVGSRAWELCDGTRTGREVAAEIRERFGPDAEPAEERAATFVAGLMAKGLVRAFDKPLRVADPHKGFTQARGFRIAQCRRCGRRHPLKAEAGARYVCPQCGKLARVPSASG